LSSISLGYLHTRRGSTKVKDFKRVEVLFDTGCDATIINKKFVKKLKTTPHSTNSWNTKGGTFKTHRTVNCLFALPEFFKHREVKWTMYVDETNNLSRYDMIIGRDLMSELGIDIKFSTGEILWDNASIPLRDVTCLDEEHIDKLENEIFFMEDPDTIDAERIQQIVSAKYSPADLQVEVEKLNLLETDKIQLYNLLSKYNSLFDGTLGVWKSEPVHLELKPDAKPYHSKPYPVPYSQERKLKEELQRFIEWKILRKVNRSEWGAPMFTISKPDGSIRSLADLRELNKRIKRKPYPIPKIQHLLHKLRGFQWVTTIDLNMGYHNILLDSESSKLCTVVLPWGKYEYLRLPMGLCNAPDIFQEKMANLMQDHEFVRTYIDDVLVLSNGTYEDHLQKVELVLARLQEVGLKINIHKSHFCGQECEYLGYWITRNGIKPLSKKVEAIHNIAVPTTKKQLRRFIGMVNFYRDMWKGRSDLLAPLSALTSKKAPWKWIETHQAAFDAMKKAIARETILAYPDFDKPFHIHTDASKVQLGAVISQDDKPIAFYSRKLSDTQTRYTTTERELLSIVETLKEFRTILLGQQIIIHTDHKNLTYATFNSDRVMRWRLFIEEYSPALTYIEGTKNVVADALSRLDINETPIKELHEEDSTEELNSRLYCLAKEDVGNDVYPLLYEQIGKAQSKDKQLHNKFKEKDTLYYLKTFLSAGKQWQLICYKDKIVIAKQQQLQIVQWYHDYLGHPGINRTEESIGQHLWWPEMRKHITLIVNSCLNCQKNKRRHKKYGHLPEKSAEAIPWDKMCIDLIGPYVINRKNKTRLVCKCVTMIDPATGWFEIHEYDDKQAISIANIAEQEWFSRYPWPTQVTFDRGREFIGHEFQDMLKNDYGITRKPITTRNPQANAIIERVHQVIGNIIRTFELQDNYLDEENPWKGILSATAFAVRSTYHTTLKKSPGQIIFGQDMIFNIEHIANWEYIRANKQKIIHKNNILENSTRSPHDYSVGDKVMLRKGSENKYEQPYSGPHTILHVGKNGTVCLQVGAIIDTVNIRCIEPYKEAPSSVHGGECNMRYSRKRR